MDYIDKLDLQTDEVKEVENLEKHTITNNKPFSVNDYEGHDRDFLALDGEVNDGFNQLKETNGIGINCIVSKRVNDLRNKQLTFEDFGAKGDGITDDTIAIQAALDWSKENKSAVYMRDKLYYVTSSLRCGNAIIRSISDVPGECDIKFLRKKDGTYMTGTHDWGYLFNSSEKYTWREVIDNCAIGPAIISDKDIKILTIGNGEVFNVRGFAVIGNHKMKNQHGLCDDIPDKYRGTIQTINNINVIGCGNNGITLNRGLEVSTLKNVNCSCNMGHGLYTGLNDFDSATEYLHFENCNFSDNRLDGVHFSYWRKDINFINCQFSGNGQYYINSIDPVLGYDRRQPTDLNMVKSGVWCDNGNVEQNNISLGFSMISCYGENCLLGLHMENIDGTGAINNVKLENNIFYRGDVPKIDNHNGSCFYININYINNWTVKGNMSHALDLLEYGKLPNDGGNNDIGDVPVFPKTFIQNEVNFNTVECKRVISDYVLFQNLAGTGTNITSDKIKNDFTLFTDNGLGNRVATYTLSAHWQSTNADRFGVYILIVTTMPSGKYIMTTLATSSVDGFSSVPTINDNGILNIPTQEYYQYTLQRIDITKTS